MAQGRAPSGHSPLTFLSSVLKLAMLLPLITSGITVMQTTCKQDVRPSCQPAVLFFYSCRLWHGCQVQWMTVRFQAQLQHQLIIRLTAGVLLYFCKTLPRQMMLQEYLSYAISCAGALVRGARGPDQSQACPLQIHPRPHELAWT